jgi:hypothetical protein
MIRFFDYLSRNGIAAILIWLLMLIIVGAIYEKMVDKKVGIVCKFLDTREKKVYFGTVIVSVILLLLSWVVSFFHKAPFLWVVLSILLLIGGLLGFIFSPKPTSKTLHVNENELKKYMGRGGLIGALITFISCFLFVYIQDPSSMIVGVIMGLAKGLTGGTFVGIAAGMFIGKYFLIRQGK